MGQSVCCSICISFIYFVASQKVIWCTKQLILFFPAIYCIKEIGRSCAFINVYCT